MKTLAQRFWSKVDKSGKCWIWRGYKNPAGYGGINVDGRCGKNWKHLTEANGEHSANAEKQ